MDTEEEGQQPSAALKPVVVVSAAFGLAILFSVIFAVAACSAGFLFSGLGVFFTVFCAILFSTIATAVSAALFKQALKRFGWFMIWGEVAILALVSVCILSWTGTREQLRILMKPMSVPDSVHVRNGRQILFSSFVHFSASPSDIAALIKSKQMIEVPDWDPDGEAAMPEGFKERNESKAGWGWWQPSSMPKPRFYYRLVKTEFSAMAEGWWISGETNEVYAYLSGS